MLAIMPVTAIIRVAIVIECCCVPDIMLATVYVLFNYELHKSIR